MKVIRKILWILAVVVLAVNFVTAAWIILADVFNVEFGSAVDGFMGRLHYIVMGVGATPLTWLILPILAIAVTIILVADLRKHDVRKTDSLLLLTVFGGFLCWSVNLGMAIMSV
ncbi:MAG: hypothetical protein ACI4SS_03880 [Clostridia bacterium]